MLVLADLADRTYTFAFAAQAFSGLRALQSMLAVGTLSTVYSVDTSQTLSTWDPLMETKPKKRRWVSAVIP